MNNRFRRKPEFWKRIGLCSIVLLPISIVCSVISRIYHLFSFRKKVNVPVISVGSPVIGGSGKTPLTKSIAKYFISLNKKVAIVTRGYPASVKDVIKVSEKSKVQEVGDEAMELFTVANVYVCKNRYQGALMP